MSNNCGEPDDDSISITWHIDDVRSLAPDLDIMDEQCREVLRRADKYHDCTIGINLGVLSYYLEQVVNEADDDPGSLDDRYQIYIACMHGTGQPVKDYDEWLQS